MQIESPSVFDVSRETQEKFNIYFDLLKKWNRNTSLVQIKTLDDFWERHIKDSLQLTHYIQKKETRIIDLGTGAGFPGMVLAIFGYTNVTLCDSNTRKCIFLEEVSRETKTPVIVVNSRVEGIGQGDYQYVISRACTALPTLLSFKENVSRETTSVGLFHKGRSYESEIQMALEFWEFKWQIFPSLIEEDSVILKVWDSKKR
jgi:16S rRNA (guanine527-N7)-methyltransferase